MDVTSIVLAFVAGFSLVLAGWFYYQLRKWARDCQQATIAVAYKRKVVMSPTLVELMLWSRKVPDKQNGQVFYKAANVTVAIIKRDKRTRRQRRQISKAQTGSTHGTWAMKQDESNAPS